MPRRKLILMFLVLVVLVSGLAATMGGGDTGRFYGGTKPPRI